MFRTLLGDTALNSGVHYWELTADDRTENELKIGIFIINLFIQEFPLNQILITILLFVILNSDLRTMDQDS